MKSMGNYDETLYLRPCFCSLLFSSFLFFRSFYLSSLCVMRPTFIGSNGNLPSAFAFDSKRFCCFFCLFLRYDYIRQDHSISNHHVFGSICFDDFLLRHKDIEETQQKKNQIHTLSHEMFDLGPVQSCIFSSLSGDQIKTN